MRYLIALLLTLAVPSLALAQVPAGYRMVCDGTSCRLVPIAAPQFVRTIYYAGVTEAAPSMRFASFESPGLEMPGAPVVGQIVSVSEPVVTKSTCNCAVTGVCLCDPATCACAACLNGRMRSTAAAVSYVSAAPVAVSYTASGNFVTRQYDAFGNVWVGHSGGRDARQAAHWTRKGIRNGWTQ